MCRAPRVPCRPPRRRLEFRRQRASDASSPFRAPDPCVPSSQIAQGDATLRPWQSVGLGVGCAPRFTFPLRSAARRNYGRSTLLDAASWPSVGFGVGCTRGRASFRFFLFRSAPLASTIFRLPTRSTLASVTHRQPHHSRGGAAERLPPTNKGAPSPKRTISQSAAYGGLPPPEEQRCGGRDGRLLAEPRGGGRHARGAPDRNRRDGARAAEQNNPGRRGPCLIIFAASEGGRRPRS